MNNIVNSINEKIIPYLIFLIIPSYLIGIAITEIFALFLIIIFFFKKESFNFYKNIPVVFLLLFSLLITLSGLLNLDYIDLKIASIAHIRFALFSIAIYYFFENVSLKKKKLSMLFLKVFFHQSVPKHAHLFQTSLFFQYKLCINLPKKVHQILIFQ